MGNDVAWTRRAAGGTGGPAYRLIDEALSGLEPYRRFRAGSTSAGDYSDWVEREAAVLAATGLNENQRNLSTRFPLDGRRQVAAMLSELRAPGILTGTSYPEQEFDQFAAVVEATFDHGGYTTYIFPEEARFLFALTHLIAPRRVVFLGSYYGYWAVWGLPGILAAGGEAVLVDIDPDVLGLAERNLKALGLDHGVEFRATDATEPPVDGHAIDLCVLDAEGPRDSAHAELREKAIYHPIMSAWTPALRPGALLVAHNMLLRNPTGNRHFAAQVAANHEQYAGFEAHLAEHYPVRLVFDTSEGVGVYQKGRDR
jgi:predicted O-methyltransferase YrrM